MNKLKYVSCEWVSLSRVRFLWVDTFSFWSLLVECIPRIHFDDEISLENYKMSRHAPVVYSKVRHISGQVRLNSVTKRFTMAM